MSSGTGQGGKTLQDRELAAKVRNLALEKIYGILQKPKHKLYGEVIKRLAATVLPRLTELSGPDGKEIPMPIYGGQSTTNKGHDSDQEDIPAQETD